MKQISFYQIEIAPFEKTLSQIIEKCYHSALKCTILTVDEEAQEILNKYLWTYSQKQFIPHGSKLDPLPQRQPVYITCELENPNNSSVLIMAGCCNSTVFNSLINQHDGGGSAYDFERLIVIYDINDRSLSLKVTAFKEDLSRHGIKFDYYTQTLNGWAKEHS